MALRGAIAAAFALTVVTLGGAPRALADPVTFLSQWNKHDSTMQLSANGAGRMVLGDGAADTDTWSVGWTKNPSDSITITLASLVARSGPGHGKVGDQYLATIQPDAAGTQVLYMHAINPDGPPMTWCPSGSGNQDPECRF